MYFVIMEGPKKLIYTHSRVGENKIIVQMLFLIIFHFPRTDELKHFSFQATSE